MLKLRAIKLPDTLEIIEKIPSLSPNYEKDDEYDDLELYDLEELEEFDDLELDDIDDLEKVEELEEFEDPELDDNIDYEPVQSEKENIEEVAEATAMTSEDVHGGQEATGDIEESPNALDEGIEDNDQTDAESSENSENSEELDLDNMSDEELNDLLDEIADQLMKEELSDEDLKDKLGDIALELNDRGYFDDIEEEEEDGGDKETNTSQDEEHDSDDFYSSQAFDVQKQRYQMHKIKNELFKLVSRISEDQLPEKVAGWEDWDVEQLMYRSFDKRPLESCKTDYEKEKLVVAIDTSGSCSEWEPFFSQIAQILVEFDVCEIYLAPNADVQSVWDKKLRSYRRLYDYHNREMISEQEYRDSQLHNLTNRNILFVGDFDGGSALCRASERNKVFWLSNEQRYNELEHHDWCSPNTFYDFKGHYYNIDDQDDLISAVKMILRDINRKPSPRENRRRHQKFMR